MEDEMIPLIIGQLFVILILNSGNTCCISVYNLSSSCLLSKS